MARDGDAEAIEAVAEIVENLTEMEEVEAAAGVEIDGVAESGTGVVVLCGRLPNHCQRKEDRYDAFHNVVVILCYLDSWTS